MIKSVYVNANRDTVKQSVKPVNTCHKCKQPGHFAARCPTRKGPKPAQEANNHVAHRAAAQRRTRASKNSGAVAQELIKGAERVQGENDALRERIADLEDAITAQAVDNHQNRGSGLDPPVAPEGNGEEADTIRLPPALRDDIEAAVREATPEPAVAVKGGGGKPEPPSDSKGKSDKPTPPPGPWDWWADPENADLAALAQNFQFSWHENFVAWQLVKSYFTFTNSAVSLLIALLIAPSIITIFRSLCITFFFLFVFNVCFIYVRNHGFYFVRKLFFDFLNHVRDGILFLAFLQGQWNFFFFQLYRHNPQHTLVGGIILAVEAFFVILGSWCGPSFFRWQFTVLCDIYFGSHDSVEFYLKFFLAVFRLLGSFLFPQEMSWISPFFSSLAWTMVSAYFTISVALLVLGFWIFGMWQVGVLLITALQIRTAEFVSFERQRCRSDLRAHTFKNQDLQDQACPFRIRVTLSFLWMRVSSFEVTVSAMLMAELVSHKYNRPGANIKDTQDRIYHACSTTGSINIDKLGFLSNKDVAGETARLAAAWARSRHETVGDWGSGF